MNSEVICGDNLAELRRLPSESVDLAYLDPPFFKQRTFKGKAGQFADTWKTRKEYLRFMERRLRATWRVLSKRGSLWLHCDHTSNAHLRILLDEVFGERQFRNEIVWCYASPSSAAPMFPRKHDTLYWYSKSKQWTFNAESVRVPYAATSLARDGGIGTGIFREHTVTLNPAGKVVESWWILTQAGKIQSEYANYPTQKPLKLLERIIMASSNAGDLVLDPFCGSGTAAVAALGLCRRFIAIDNNPEAIAITNERLKAIQARFA